MKVIVFALHGCPTGWLGAYGNDWVGTPNLDRLAAEGVTFDSHISDCPEPNAARHAWLGRPTPPVPEEPAPSPSVCSPALSAELLAGRGANGGGRGAGSSAPPFPGRTVLVRANHPDTDGPDWFYAGWGEVFDARPRPDDASPLDELLRTFPELLDRLANVPDFLLWIETDRLIPPWDVQQDVFEAYVRDAEGASEVEPPQADDTPDEDEDEDNETEDEAVDEPAELVEEIGADSESSDDDASPIIEPLPPFADPPTGPFDRTDLDAWYWLHQTFAAVTTKFDAELGGLFDELRARGLDRSAAWVLTSDFGLPLGEHGQIGSYRPWLHEELVHLPLFLRLPGAEQAGRRVAGFTQPPDVYATLLALLGAPPPADATGFNLLPLARGERNFPREFAVTALELGSAAEMALRTDDYALLVPTRVPDGDPPREPLLYAKPDDRWEVNDLRPRNIERADELEAKLRAEQEKKS